MPVGDGAYVTLAHMALLHPEFDFTSGVVKDVNLAAYIDNVESDFEAVCLAVGIAVPITGTRPLELARDICALGVSARVVDSNEANITEKGIRAATYRKQHRERLDEIRRNPDYFSEAPKTADYSADAVGQGNDATNFDLTDPPDPAYDNDYEW